MSYMPTQFIETYRASTILNVYVDLGCYFDCDKSKSRLGHIVYVCAMTVSNITCMHAILNEGLNRVISFTVSS